MAYGVSRSSWGGRGSHAHGARRRSPRCFLENLPMTAARIPSLRIQGRGVGCTGAEVCGRSARLGGSKDQRACSGCRKSVGGMVRTIVDRQLVKIERTDSVEAGDIDTVLLGI